MKNTIGGIIKAFAKAILAAGAVMPAIIAVILIISGSHSLIVSIGISLLLTEAFISLTFGILLYCLGAVISLIYSRRERQEP